MPLSDSFKRIQLALTGRHAYRDTFDPKSKSARLVLADLALFCCATATTHQPDSDATLIFEGRRQVFLRIQDHLNMSVEEAQELVADAEKEVEA